MSAPVRIIQLSDMHLFGDKDRELLGVKTDESFKAVVNHLKKEEPFDFIILSGDLSQDCSELAYVRISDLLKPFRVPIYSIPGNHDDTKIMSIIYPYEMISTQRQIILKDWQIILLDSQRPGGVEGYLDHLQLNFLQHCLQTYPEHYAIVAFHHQPIPVGARWLDNLGVTNASDLWQILTHYPKVHTLLYGHVHQEFAAVEKGIKCYAVPSTCIQFKPNHDDFSLDNIPPGYRIIELYPDGELKTRVERIEKYIGVFDPNAKGY